MRDASGIREDSERKVNQENRKSGNERTEEERTATGGRGVLLRIFMIFWVPRRGMMTAFLFSFLFVGKASPASRRSSFISVSR